jgi:hypothetical protein
LLVPGKGRFFLRGGIVDQRSRIFRDARHHRKEATSAKQAKRDSRKSSVTNCCRHRRRYLQVAPGPRGPKWW